MGSEFLDGQNQEVLEGQVQEVQEPSIVDLVVFEDNVPFGWRHRLSIGSRKIKQSKLFFALNQQEEERLHLPVVHND